MELEFKGTQGGWILRQFPLGQMSVRTVDDTRKIFVSRVNNFEESEANMKLGAAAPDLLEACQQLLSRFEPKDGDTWDLKAQLMAKRAIEKALK